MIEFLFDTTRAVTDLVLNGTIARSPALELIVPHAGAVLPLVADRISAFSMLLGVDTTVDVQRDLARLHYDLAGHAVPRALDVRSEERRVGKEGVRTCRARGRP